MFCILALVCLLAPSAAPASPVQLPGSLPAAGGEASPPTVIEGLDAQPSAPLEFSRAWLGRVQRVRQRRAELRSEGRLDGMRPSELAAEGAALAGTLRIPVIPVKYADVAAPFDAAELDDRLFGSNRADTVGLAGYWREASGGLLEVEGTVTPWARLPEVAEHYLPAREYGWAQFGKVREFRREAIEAVDGRVDFGRFDNDGPDGIPNSGDDDGYVDLVAILYAVRCSDGGREGALWPHRGAMEPYETNDPAAGGGRIKVADYLINPAQAPGSCDPLETGVLAHETAHAFGLPDLYDYDGSSQGIGAWGLMGTGSHSEPHSPAHPSAWVKEQLGWVAVRWLRESRDRLELPPVQRDRTVFRYDRPDGRYLLLENRQRLGSDAHLPGSGLLVWSIDPQRGELMAWNGDEERPAVGLLPGDGRDDLAHGRPADPGDPLPGHSRRRSFVLEPDRTFRLDSLRLLGESIVGELTLGHSEPALLARPHAVHMTATAPSDPIEESVEVRREGGARPGWTVRGAPGWLEATPAGDRLRLRAKPDRLAPGDYSTTLELASADGESAIGRLPVQLTVPATGEPMIIAERLSWSWGLAAVDGRLVQASYGWDPLGLRRRPGLLELDGARRYPRRLTRLPAEALYAPVAGRDGVVYVLARARGANYVYRVSPDGTAEILASGLHTAPAYGLTALPGGDLLVGYWNGRVQRVTADGRVAPWARLPARLYQIAANADGDLYAATYEGDIMHVDAGGAVERIETGFGSGGLVAIAVAPDGAVYAAERGGAGRVVRVSAEGGLEVLARIEDAQFYGLAVENDVLYALDLNGRTLVSIPVPEPSVARASR